MGAPMCQLGPVIPPQPSAPPVYSPNIPVITPNSIIPALQAVKQLLGVSQNGSPAPNQYTTIGPINNNINNIINVVPSQSQLNGPSNFRIGNQVTEDVDIFDPNDPSGQTFVTVNRTTALTLTNPATKQSWVWQLNP